MVRRVQKLGSEGTSVKHRMIVAVGLLIGLAATPLGAKEHSVGTHGVRIQVDDSWGSVPTLDGGQWRFQRGHDVVSFIEVEVLVDTAVDVATLLDEWAKRCESLLDDVVAFDTITFERGGLFCGTKRLEVTENSIRCSYILSLFARDGLAMHVLTLTPLSKAKTLPAIFEDFTSDLEFPGPETEWGKSAVRTRRTLEIEGHRVSFETQPSVWVDGESDDALLYLVSPREHLSLSLYTSSYPPAEDVGLTLEALRDPYPGIVEVDRQTVQVAGIESQHMRAEVRGEHGVELVFRLYSIPLAEGTTVDLRLVNQGGWESRRPFFDRTVDSIEISRLADVDAFPVVEEVATTTPPLPEISALLERCRFVGVIRQVRDAGAFRFPDGRIVAFGRGRIGALSPSGEESLWFDSDWNMQSRSVLRCGDTLYYRGRGGRLAVFNGTTFRWPDFLAMAVAPADEESLLVSRREPPGSDSVFQATPAIGPDRLLMRAADGVEQEIWLTRSHQIESIDPSFSGSEVLLALRPSRVHEQYEWHEPHELAGFDPSTKVVRPLGKWRLDHLGPADEGWVVTGTPAGGTEGIYYLLRDGSARLLVSGVSFAGVEIREGKLLFAGAPRLETHGPTVGTAFYEGELPVILERGPLVMPFSATVLNALGAAAAAAVAKGHDELFRDWATVSGYVAAAQVLSLEQYGRSLPTAPEAVDHLLSDSIRFATFFDAHGVSLLAALIATALVGEGAEWVPAVSDQRFAWRSPPHPDHCFAYALSPLAMVSSTLFDSNGYWRPLREATAAAEGRRVLLGVDPGSLASRMAQLDQATLLEWIENTYVSELAALFERLPSNHYLRHEVYEHLYARGRFSEVLTLASFRQRPEAVFVDHLAALGAQHALLEGAPTPELVAQFHETIRQYPDASRLYLLLGQLYQRQTAGDPEAKRRARACFAKAVELDADGDVGQRAKEAIGELDEG